MTPSEISRLVNAQIRDQQRLLYRPEFEVEARLVRPYQSTCATSLPGVSGEQVFEIWVVFEEQTGHDSGYVVGYQEGASLSSFVLAVWNGQPHRLAYLGRFQTFVEALSAL